MVPSLRIKMVPVSKDDAPEVYPPVMVDVTSTWSNNPDFGFQAELWVEGRFSAVSWRGVSPEVVVGKAVLHARKYNPESGVVIRMDRESEEAARF